MVCVCESGVCVCIDNRRGVCDSVVSMLCVCVCVCVCCAVEDRESCIEDQESGIDPRGSRIGFRYQILSTLAFHII